MYSNNGDAVTRPSTALAPALLKRGSMIEPIFQADTYQLARKLLDAAALRQEAIASNVANAETPGYRRLDVAPAFSEQLRAQMATGTLSTSEPMAPQLAEDPTARSTRPDGNNVEIESELLAMNKNSVEYDYLTQVVSSNLKQLRMAITGTIS
jgi:flagellar basal-body rod protein FlgB